MRLIKFRSFMLLRYHYSIKSLVLVLSLLGFVGLTAGCKQSAQSKKQVVRKTLTPGERQFKVIEIIGSSDTVPETGELTKAIHNRPSQLQLYRWKNHLVVLTDGINADSLQRQLQAAYKNYQIRSYNQPFYKFTRNTCTDKGNAEEWDNIILTANLVNDAKLQQEYLNYHATQYQKWPEVAQGFCNASFQQLLVFKNGRQLILIISIPKGASLDELNPKTTENNPRVVEWNNIMKKYQEGIAGTKPGEVWVFLEPVKANR